jgi:ABC-type transport system involved in cytochrome c biogenesis permease subunit
MDETLLLRGALGSYALGALAACARRWQRPALALLGLAVSLHTLSLARRWAAHGQGPFTTLHEILSSSVWSLALVFLVCALLLREARAAWVGVGPVLALLGAWLLVTDAGRGHLPATYATSLLYLHAVTGKLFLGLLLVATGLGLVPWWQRLVSGGAAPDAAADARRAELAYRLAAAAFVCDSLMLIVGAIWALDAWGRYWAWDPLETWAFLTWLALALALHARATRRPAPPVFGLWLAAVFALAFLTFFGVPFLSTSPHKGAL